MENVALLVIDVQKGLDDPKYGQRNNLDAEANIAKLLAHWRKNKRPVIHAKHNSTDPGSPLRPGVPGNDIKPEAMPLEHEPLFEKTVNSAFIGTGLETYLHQNKISSLVIVGLITDHCVSTTTRMAANLGFEATLISDATATFERMGHNGSHFTAEQMHNINLAALNEEFCTIKSTSELIQPL